MDEVQCNGVCFLLLYLLKSISLPSPSSALRSLSLTSVINFAHCVYCSGFLSLTFSLSLSPSVFLSEFISLPRKLFFRDFVLSLTASLTPIAMQPLSDHLPSLPLPIPYFQLSPHLSSSLFRIRLFLLISCSSLSSYDFSPLVFSLQILALLLIIIFSPALLPISISLLHDLLLPLPNSSASAFSLSSSLPLS